MMVFYSYLYLIFALCLVWTFFSLLTDVISDSRKVCLQWQIDISGTPTDLTCCPVRVLQRKTETPHMNTGLNHSRLTSKFLSTPTRQGEAKRSENEALPIIIYFPSVGGILLIKGQNVLETLKITCIILILTTKKKMFVQTVFMEF